MDNLAKTGSTLNSHGPEPFAPVPYASCTSEIRDWCLKRWKSSWLNKKDCLRTRRNVGWASPRLSQRLLSLKRPYLNQVMQVLTGHCNLQRHKKTTGRSESSLCPKCGLEDETPNHHVGVCSFYQDVRTMYLGNKTTIRSFEQDLSFLGSLCRAKVQPLLHVVPGGSNDFR